jgi:hypothetical protein
MSNTSNYANQASIVGVPTIRTTTTTNNTGGNFLISNPHGNHWGTGTINQNQLYQIHQSNPPNLEVKGKMTLNGRDLEERLDAIEKVLHIPERDVKLEKKHPKLKKLYDEYMAALGKYRTFESLKGDE